MWKWEKSKFGDFLWWSIGGCVPCFCVGLDQTKQCLWPSENATAPLGRRLNSNNNNKNQLSTRCLSFPEDPFGIQLCNACFQEERRLLVCETSTILFALCGVSFQNRREAIAEECIHLPARWGVLLIKPRHDAARQPRGAFSCQPPTICLQA